MVGAGLAGLSAALHLRGAGVDVTVIEEQPTPGGRCPDATIDGYRLDLGPTVLTETDQLATVFAAVGESMDDHLTLRALDPAYVAHFADGSTLPMHSDSRVMHDVVAGFAGQEDAAGYDRFVRHVQRLYDVEFPHFIDRNLDGVHSLIGPALLRLAALRGLGRMDHLIASFFRDERLRQAFSFQSLYVGVPPHKARGMFAVVSAMDLVHGVSYPVGGMYAIVRALAEVAGEHGVDIRLGERVHAVRGSRGGYEVGTDCSTELTDAVVMTCEPDRATTLFTDPRPIRSVAEPSPSCVLLAAGVPAGLPGDGHHHLHFGASLRGALDDITDGRPMRDPSFLVSVPTRTDPTMAPTGADVMYALFPAPARHGRGMEVDWRSLRGSYRDHMLRRLSAAGYAVDDLVGEQLITPQDWDDRGMPWGTPFSSAHTFRQSGPFRQANLIGPRLAFAGSGTTPGVGVPMVLISGRLAAERVLA
ncbi:phytoene dehydrogenase [Flexivirga endophytica]|uniref:Phytoene dehydrogenase n=1 Tax=Flexivirga endophytica TaxID=1849103 RepID=A0A916SYU3_9MICO|nr:phytoene desaturase family protein [Flexivirga endophytica]GGB20722.1 phytoene dehydrogenase [Flexivirga endophytica]GHB58560.1 phytoene dehydrogenase [Flexivirga endophytica]